MTGIRAFQELAEFLLADLNGLGRCCVRHAKHRTPQIEGVSYVRGDSKEDEEDEVDWVAKD